MYNKSQSGTQDWLKHDSKSIKLYEHVLAKIESLTGSHISGLAMKYK